MPLNGPPTSSSFSLTPGAEEANLGLANFKGKILGFSVELELTGEAAPLLWYPAHLGDVKHVDSNANVKMTGFKPPSSPIPIKADATVLGRDIITLPATTDADSSAGFGTGSTKVAAYRFRTKISAMGYRLANYTWFVPNLGIVAQGPSASLASKPHLVGVSLKNPSGAPDAITGVSDSDQDGLPDWKELAIVGSDLNSDDTDGDLIEDGDDNCPSTSNAGQEDSDADHVGDACEAVQSGTPKVGSKVIDKVADASDTINATLTGCKGLADAIVKLPSIDSPDNIKVTIGETLFGAFKGTDFSVKKGTYSLPFAVNSANGKPIAKLSLLPATDSIVLTGAKLQLTFPETVDGKKSIALKVEIGGWSCESTADWSVGASTSKLTRLVIPRP
jgi:hypothetical protein